MRSGKNTRDPAPVGEFEVYIHSTGLSLWEVIGVLDLLAVKRSHVSNWCWVHALTAAQSDPLTAARSWVGVDETQIKIDDKTKWFYGTTDAESKLLLETDVFGRCWTGPRYLPPS